MLGLDELLTPKPTAEQTRRSELPAPTYPQGVKVPYLGYFSQDDQPYDLTDYPEVRKRTLANVAAAVKTRFPLESDKYILTVDNLHYVDKDYKPSDEKYALLNGKTLGTRLKGDWVLYDKATGKELERKSNNTLVNVPYLTNRGVFIRSGNEYGLKNTFRLRPGLYTRIKGDGIIATHVNPAQGTGRQANIMLNPTNGVFTWKMGTRNYGLLPLLMAAGKTEEELRAAWGDELFDNNFKKYEGIITGKSKAEAKEYNDLWQDKLSKYILDEDTTSSTLGAPYKQLNGDAILAATNKILRVAQTYSDDETDERDSLRYQTIMGAADYLPERIVRDGGGLFRKVLNKIDKEGTLASVPSGVFQPHVDAVFQEDRHAGYIDGASPVEALDFTTAVSRVGEGGLGTERAASDESRGVNNSYLGFIDAVRSPESQQVGLQVYMTHGVKKDSTGQLWTKMIPRVGDGSPVYVSMKQASQSNVATPEYYDPQGNPEEIIPAFRQGRDLEYMPRKDVDFYLADSANMMSDNTGFIPGIGGLRSNRTMLGSKASSQAMSLPHREAPLVRRYLRNEDGTDGTTESYMGRKMGAKFADTAGVITDVTDDEIVYRDDKGKKHVVDLYNQLPANNKGWLTNTPQVKVGDVVKPGQILASSNYTDDEGNAALGVNLRVAMVSAPDAGSAFDAIAVSESAAKTKLASEQLYKTKSPVDNETVYDKNRFLKSFDTSEFTKEQLDTIGDDGIVMPGTELHKGDPMVLAIGLREPGIKGVSKHADTPIVKTWEHDYPGTVMDVGRTNKAVSIYTQALTPARVGDKLSAIFGNKGVIGKIIPDEEMLQDENGQPFEVYQSPLGIPSRVNPMVLGALQLGKIAKHTGKPVVWKDFSPEPMADTVLRMLDENGLKESENLFDPNTGKTVPDVATGYLHYLKFKHMGDVKEKSRGTGDYTMEDLPLKGGDDSARRFGSMEIGALFGHAGLQSEVMKDAKLVRGQANHEFWRAVRNGEAVPTPSTPLVHRKFFEHLRAAGVTLEDRGDRIHMFAATEPDVERLTQNREVKSGATYDAKELRPIQGGLFDPQTFGANGDQWAYYQLPEPVLNPLMEKAVVSILGWKDRELQGVLNGEQEVNGKTGPDAVKDILGKLDLEKEYHKAKVQLKSESLPALKRDKILKRYRAIASLLREGKSPQDLFLSRIPILPPKYRPISVMGNDVGIVSDANYLYKAMIDASEDFRDAKDQLPDEMLLDARKNLHTAIKAVVGLTDSPDKKLQEKGVEGVLKWAFGKGSPKCYADDTDILTESGWIPFKDYIDSSTRVATVNPKTLNFEWQHPVDIIHTRYAGNMVHTRTRRVDLLVTPNHMHFVKNRVGRKTKRWAEWNKVTAETLTRTTTRRKMLVAANRFFGCVPSIPEFIDDPLLGATFVGWFIADGWLHTENYAVYIDVKTGGTKDRLLSERLLVHGSNFERRVYTRKAQAGLVDTPDGYQVTRFLINSTELCAWLAQHIGRKADTKRLSAVVKGWDYQYLEALWNGYIQGDGEKRSLGKQASGNTWYNRKFSAVQVGCRASTASRALVDDFMEIGCKLGIQINLQTITAPGDGRKHPLYRLSAHGFNTVTIEYKKQNAIESYDGMVHCVTVPNGLVVVRRAGKVAVSGNSGSLHRKVFGATVDLGGLAVAAPDSKLGIDEIGLPERSAWSAFEPFVVRNLRQRGYPLSQAMKAVQEREPIAKQALEEELSKRPVLVNRAPTLHKYNIMAFMPRLIKGNTIRYNPLVAKDYAVDADGDLMSFHVPVSRKAVNEAIERMLPSKNLLSASTLKARMVPVEEFAQGLYIASRAPKGKPIKFASKEAMLQALNAGKITYDTPVEFPN